jgi:hypothetical protein
MTVARQLKEKHSVVVAAGACFLCFACGSNSPSGSTSTGGSSSGGTPSTGGTSAGPAGAQNGGSGGSPSAAGSGGVAPAAGGSLGSGGSIGGTASNAGSAGVNGGAPGAGGSAGSAASPIVPVEAPSAGLFRFTAGDLILEVDPKTGGRVSKYSLAGADMIMTKATDATTWGSVFWTSPRLKTWSPEWPPPAAIDNGAYTASISGSHLMLTGMADATLGVSMAKDYSADSASGWVTINYTINSSKAQKAAPWEVSRVPRGGIAFFPLGSSVTAGPLTITQSNGMVWFDDGPKTATSPDGSKLVADGKDGWEAYAFGGTLFLKRFTDQPTSAQVPSPEGEICLYPGATWVEFEVQGPYTSIAAAGNLSWKVQWRLVKIPSSVTVSVGSASLVAFAQQQVAIP